MSEPRRRRWSRDVVLVAVPVLAAAFVACGGSDKAYCVDANDRIVENARCDSDILHAEHHYFWYYGGSVAGGKHVRGARMKGGDRVGAADIAGKVRRDGFGKQSKKNPGGYGRGVTSISARSRP